MRSRVLSALHVRLSCAFAVVALAACHRPADVPRAVGRVNLAVAIAALNGNGTDVDTVTVTVTSNDDMSIPPIVTNLTFGVDGWTGVIGGLPAGYDHFDVIAQEMGVTIYAGAADETILENQTITVMILLQQSTPNSTFGNNSPTIDSISASSDAVAPGDTVSIIAMATAGAMGDTLTFLWSDGYNAGDFDSIISETPTWTAPSMPGSYTITLTVTNQLNASVTASFDISDLSTNAVGAGNVELQFNASPVITDVYSSPSNVLAGGSTPVSVECYSPDSDYLYFTWSDNSCGGYFDNPSAQYPMYTAPASSGTCTLSVVVNDQYNDSSSGSTFVVVGPAVPSYVAPQLTAIYQSVTTAALSDMVYLSVTVDDLGCNCLETGWSNQFGNTNPITSNVVGTTYTAQYQIAVPDGPYYFYFYATFPASGVTTNYTFTVDSINLDSITVTPYQEPYSVGVTQQMTATGSFDDAVNRNVTTFVNWSSPNMGVATVDGNGLVTTTGPGSVQITAGTGGVFGYQSVNVAYGYIQASTGYASTCAVRQDNTLWCWGDDTCGQAGDTPYDYCIGVTENGASGEGNIPPVPQQVLSDTDWAQVAVGGESVCGLKLDGTLYCWGTPQVGNQVANPSGGMEISPSTYNLVQTGQQISFSVSGGTPPYTWVVSTPNSGCAEITACDSSAEYTAGMIPDVNDVIQVTDSTEPTQFVATVTVQVFNETPHPVTGAPALVTLGMGEEDDGCGLDAAGNAWCWGPNLEGEAGDGDTNSQPAPVMVPTTAPGMTVTTWSNISVADSHVCGAMSDTTGWCWGFGGDGEIGNGLYVDYTSPQQVLDCTDDNGDGTCGGSLVPGTWRWIVAGTDDSCGGRTDGVNSCWGGNYSGELGIGNSVMNYPFPENISETYGECYGLHQISLGNEVSCAFQDVTGAAYCWGYGQDGDLGDGLNVNSNVPVQVTGTAPNTWLSVSVGDDQGCAINSNYQLECWGDDSYLELGDNDWDYIPTNEPQQVVQYDVSGAMIVVTVDDLTAELIVQSGSDFLTFEPTGSPRSQIFATPISNNACWDVSIYEDDSGGNCYFDNSSGGTSGGPNTVNYVQIECGGCQGYSRPGPHAGFAGERDSRIRGETSQSLDSDSANVVRRSRE